MELLKIKPWGPKRLREIIRQIVEAINARTPKEGFGTRAKENPDGVMIHAEVGASGSLEAQVDEKITGSSGTASIVYGSLNGQPAKFNLIQSAPPELVVS